jgi:DnaK suppressor protein
LDTAAAQQRLEHIREQLDRSIAVLRGSEGRTSLLADYPQDPADAGSNLAESDRTEAVLGAASAQRTLVLDALRRLASGTYGICVDCGAAVPEGRLEAKPEAARCVPCQARRDRRRR